MAIPDYSNIKFDMKSINTFFKDQGVNIAAGDSAKLNTIFKECDTEGAKNEKGEKTGDGVLNGQERATFLDKIKNACPQIYDKVIDFFTVVDVTEDLAAKKETEEDALDKLDNLDAEFEKQTKQLDNILEFNHKFKGQVSDEILQKQTSTLKSITDEKEFNEKITQFEMYNTELMYRNEQATE